MDGNAQFPPSSQLFSIKQQLQTGGGWRPTHALSNTYETSKMHLLKLLLMLLPRQCSTLRGKCSLPTSTCMNTHTWAHRRSTLSLKVREHAFLAPTYGWLMDGCSISRFRPRKQAIYRLICDLIQQVFVFVFITFVFHSFWRLSVDIIINVVN